ncbi:MAG TPA: IPT/TIG domain-containing protein [Planctomycetota bacterium]|jgi:hypothetical protein|nr:IPT/TIG domain-containing protein [Planctomycetota bacterium]
MIRGARLALTAAAVLVGVAAFAHIRLLNPSNGAKLHWATPSSIGIVISSAGSPDIPAGLHFPALRNAIAAWNASAGTTEHLVEDTSPVQQARTDWQDDALHEILFDETNASGYFPSGTGIVALTPIWFASDGRITDADVLFNGSGFSFTTSGESGRFDVQDVATHELGHFLGLDHSGWAGATMYPYVDPTVILHRSLSLDEERGMRDAYPAGVFASISGKVRRQADGTLVAGAHVVARDAAGRTAAGALADRLGAFQLRGLDAGSYTVYATPLDYPVSASNLATGNTVQVDFATTSFGMFAVAAGQALAIGDQSVAPNVAVSLGRNSDPYPLRCVAGSAQILHVRGSGLATGSTLAASDPTLTITPLSWMGTAVTFQATVPAGAAPGHVDLTVTDPGGNSSTVPAAIEITPQDPQVNTVSPASGDAAGGTLVTITGVAFRAGARVVLGENIYPDGQPGGCTVVDANTIQLVTAPTAGGSYDAVVLDTSGVEGRRTSAFLFTSNPVIDSVFPAGGSAAGGTTVILRGSGFVAGSAVAIDGVAQPQLTFDDPTRITFVTEPGVAGGPYVLSIANPGGGTSSSSFTYTAASDPALLSVAPTRGAAAGGESVLVHGANFPANAAVAFGADVDTGAGGVPASSVTWIDASTLEVVTPAHASGTVSVLVTDPASGQAAVISSGFTYGSSGGGAGGCSISPSGSPRSPLDALSGGAWLLALAALVLMRARRARAEPDTGSW